MKKSVGTSKDKNILRKYVNLFLSASPKKRMGVLLSLGVFGIAVTYLLTMVSPQPETAPVQPPVAEQKAVALKDKPAPVANAAQGDMPMRNPFEPPADYRNVEQQQQQQSGDTTSRPQEGRPRTSGIPNLDEMLKGKLKTSERPGLLGVIEGNGRKAAIIRYGGGTRSYQMYERVGPYSVSAISKDSVLLDGPDGRLALTLGR